jgi:tetratricopeptide (TPR) repeat protein
MLRSIAIRDLTMPNLPMPDLLQQALAHRAGQRMAQADAALTEAQQAAPDDARLAFALAQLRYERGLPAADLFARAVALDPANRDALRNCALAEASEGKAEVAMARLDAALAASPDWLDGQRVLASLRWVAGDAVDFDRGWAAAARAHPQQPGLWLGWFGALAQLRDWPRAIAVLDAAQHHLGETAAIVSARMFVAGEQGALDQCAALLERLTGREDDFLQIARIRLALRQGDAVRARDHALAMLHGPGARQAWPYLGTAWRLLGDPQADWLEGDPAFVRAHDVGLSPAELAELSQVLRGLHAAQAPYAEQTVRLGTQTDRSVLLRHEPILTRARAALLQAVQAHVAGLPRHDLQCDLRHDPRHPLLSARRDDLILSGSWSVRLGPGGFNVVHTHPQGWLSSAFYVALPEPNAMGPAPAGHFEWGAPPAELGLDLRPRGVIAPVVGQVVLFPSYVWHGTVPIERGERLNIAFDVVPRQRSA